MQINKKNFTMLLAAAFLAGCGVALAVMILLGNGILGETVKIEKDQYRYYQQLDDRYSKLNQIYEEITANYYKEPDKENLETGMYKGLMAGLGDVYSGYMTAQEFRSWSDTTLGEFEGIGINFSVNTKGEFVILSTIPGTPAEKAGLQSGDLILAVDGKVYGDMETVSTALKGKAGTKVRVTYERDGKEREVTIKRAKIISQTVESKMLKNRIGYMALSSFEEHTAEDFKKQLADLEKKGAKGLIIDLRDNGGGLVASGTEIADALLGEGTITYLQDRKLR